MSRSEYIYLEPIALIGHDAVLTRGRCSTYEEYRSTHLPENELSFVQNMPKTQKAGECPIKNLYWLNHENHIRHFTHQ